MFALYVLNIKEFLRPKRISGTSFKTRFEDIFAKSAISFSSKKEKFSYLIFKNDIYSASYCYSISKNHLLLVVPANSATIPLRNILPYKPENNILIENKINEIKLEDSKSWFLFKKELELSDIKNYFLETFDGYYLCTNKSKIMKKYSDRIQTINLKAILEELDTNIIRLL